MWIIIPIGAIVGGPVGFFIALGIFLWLSFLEAQSKESGNDNAASAECDLSEMPKIKALQPIVFIVCYYCTEDDQDWNKEKVSFVKNEFEEYCKNHNDLLLLRDMIKVKHHSIHKLIKDFHTLGPDEDARNKTFILCYKAIILNNQDRLYCVGRKLIDLANKINPNVELFNCIMAEVEENDRLAENHDDKSEWAKNVLGLNGNITERDVIDAFRKKAKAYHPDKNPNVTDEVMVFLNQKLNELKEAKDILILSLKDNI